MASWSYGERELPWWANLAIIVAIFVVIAVVGVWQS